MKNYMLSTKRILILAAVFIMSSCIEETEIILQSPLEEAIVVDVKLTTDTMHHKAILSKTGDYYLYEQTPRVSGANIKITSETGDVILFEEIEPGIYQTIEKVYGLVGEEYYLEIEYDDELYESKSKIRRKPNIDSIGFRWQSFMESYRVLYYGQEHPGIGDFYLWHIYKNGELMTDSLHKIMFTSDEMFDGQYIYGIEIDYWGNDFDFQVNDTITVEMHSITKDTDAFLYEIYLESGGSGPSGGSGKTPVGNISNGAFGLFYTSSVVRKTAIIEEDQQ